MINKKTITVLILFVAIYLCFQIPFLGREAINPDAVNWHYRSEQFVVGLKNSLWTKTYQHYHPGVTLMWLTGIPIELFKQVTGVEVYNQYTFYAFHFLAKFSLIFVQLGLAILIIYWLTKIIGFKKALATGALFMFEPFVLGDSRLYHMDILFTLLVFSSLILSFLSIKEGKKSWYLLTGVFISLTFLTRSLGIGLYFFVITLGSLFYFYKNRSLKNTLMFVFLITTSFVMTTFLLFPALWVKPVYVIKNIFTESARIGVKEGHTEIFFGRETENPGWLFYPVVIFLKSTPFLLLGILIFKFNLFKQVVMEKKNLFMHFRADPIAYLAIFYLGYFLTMMLATKKLDRYMLVLFPFMSLIAVLGYGNFLEKFKNKALYLIVVGLLIMIFVIWPDISYFPYQFTYANPIFGSSTVANQIIGQKSFGLGIFEVKDYLEGHYGSNVKVGFIDTKPIKAIYPNSLVSDIRVNGASDYDVLVLAVNEQIPQKVIKTGVKFTKDGSIYIHGLEYWRFYVKQK